MRKLRLLLACLLVASIGLVNAQTRTASGTVVSAEDGQPIVGASVVVKGTTQGISTNANGKFSLNVSTTAKTLVISYIGMTTTEVNVGADVTVRLQPQDKTLDEVLIVVPYGTTKRSSFTGSAATVDSKKLEARPISNISQALSGAAPGVQTTIGGGQPGSGLSIRIRGFGSINASSAPLYVVDGAIYNGNISDMNPADIENITILKDAASTSLYGSSAGNGVVLVTTKNGSKGQKKPSINFSTTFGTSQRGIPEYERIGIWDYYPVMWKQLYNREIFSNNATPAAAAAAASKNVFDELKYNPFKGVAGYDIVGADGKLNPAATTLLYGDDVDWEKGITRNAFRQEYGISLNYQGDKADTYASIGYLKDNGYTIKSDFSRFSGRLNSTYKPTNWLKAGMSISAFRTSSGTIGDGETAYVNPFFFTRFMSPIYPIHLHDDITGDYILDVEGNKIYDFEKARGKDGKSGRHVIAEMENNFVKNTRDGLNSRSSLEFKLMPELTFTTNLTYDNSNAFSTDYTNRIVGDSKGKGALEKANGRSTSVTLNELLQYERMFDKHTLSVLLGHENYYYQYESHSSRKTKQVLDDLYEYGNFVTPEDLSSYTDNYRKEGYFTRLNYNYDSKYYGSLSFRRDGSSRFKDNKRWGNFWSGGLSWRISQEKFLANARWIDDLKFRTSYGQTGNDALGTFYAYQTLYALGYNNNEQPGILFSKLGNPDLMWETQINWDAAIEFAFFRRVRGTIEYFNKQSKDLLFSLPLPLSSGTPSVNANIGKVRNQGVEIELNVDILKEKDFLWTVGINGTHVNNKVLELPANRKEILSGTKKITEGHSIYDYWLKQYRGVDPEDGAALYTFDSKNTFSADDCRITAAGDTLTTNQAKAKYDYNGKSSIPKVYGGFNTMFRYKDFELGANFTYQLGGTTYDGAYQSLMGMDGMGGALHVDAMNKSWKQKGDVTDVPRLDAGQPTNFNATSDRWLISSNALLLKSLYFSYNLPKNILSKVSISQAKITLSGENLFYLTKRKGLDPMQSYDGTVGNFYTTSRVFTVGLQFSL